MKGAKGEAARKVVYIHTDNLSRRNDSKLRIVRLASPSFCRQVKWRRENNFTVLMLIESWVVRKKPTSHVASVIELNTDEDRAFAPMDLKNSAPLRLRSDMGI